MSLKEELMYDFAVNMPRILVSGRNAVIDNIKKVELISGDEIIVKNGKRFTDVSGRGLLVDELDDERMLIEGEITDIQFYDAPDEDKDRRIKHK